MTELEYLNKRIDITTWAMTQLARLLRHDYPSEVSRIGEACANAEQELEELKDEQ